MTGRPNPAAFAPSGADVIDIYGEITPYEGGISAKAVLDQLRAVAGGTVHVRLNSNGGDVYEGIAIYNDLIACGKRIAVTITGIAASAASLICMAADEIAMAPGSRLMIHNSWSWGEGPATYHESVAAELKQIDASMAEFYAARSGKNPDDVRAMMEAESYFGAAEAVAAGFADRIDGAIKASPLASPAKAKFVRRPIRISEQARAALQSRPAILKGKAMPQKQTVDELIAKSREMRAAIAAKRQLPGAGTGSAALRERMQANRDGSMRATEELREDYNSQPRQRDRVQARVDPLDRDRDERRERYIAALERENRAMAQRVAARRVTGGDGQAGSDGPRAAHRQAFHAWFRNGGNPEAVRDLAIKAQLHTQTDTDGGMTVPKEVDTQIESMLGQVSVMRQLATVRPITVPLYELPYNKGGTSSGWVNERDDRDETDTPKMAKLSFGVFEVYANPVATQIMLDDSSMNIESWLAEEVQTEFAEQEGDAFINGNNVSKPFGLLAYPKVANSSYNPVTHFGSIGYIPTGAASDFAETDPADCLLDLIYGLKRAFRNSAAFLTNDTTLAKIRKFKQGTGEYIWQPSVQQGEPGTIFGKPVETDDFMDEVGADKFPVAFGDFKRSYLILDRMGTRVLRNPYKKEGFINFYTTKRVGGGMRKFESMKLLKVAAS